MKVNGKDDIPYIMENKNVPNLQPNTYCGWASEILYQLIDGQHPIIYRVSTIQYGGFRNHPQYFGHLPTQSAGELPKGLWVPRVRQSTPS